VNLFLLLLAIAAVSAAFFGWIALEYRRTPVDDGEKDWQYIGRMAPTPKDRIDALLEDDAATRERRP
jgi:hypothetical protein